MTVRRQLVRFALVGIVNTGTYYGCYLSLLTWLPYIAAHVAACVLSMTGSFFLTSYFTYRTRPTWRKFLLFPLTNAANFTITTGGVWLLVDAVGFSDRWAPLVAASAAIPVTFVVSRTILLGPERPSAGGPADGRGDLSGAGQRSRRTTFRTAAPRLGRVPPGSPRLPSRRRLKYRGSSAGDSPSSSSAASSRSSG